MGRERSAYPPVIPGRPGKGGPGIQSRALTGLDSGLAVPAPRNDEEENVASASGAKLRAMLSAYGDLMWMPFSNAGRDGAQGKHSLLRITVLAVLLTGISAPQALALSKQQQGMFFHGMWEWSLKNCPGAYRNKGYWYALREVGQFESSTQIVGNEGGENFQDGWEKMALSATLYGIDATCDHAFEQWPAVLYRE